jgi:hypothetical protein
MIYLRYEATYAPEHPQYGEPKTLIAHIYADSPEIGDAKYKAELIERLRRVKLGVLLHEEVLEEPKEESQVDEPLLSYFRSARQHQVHCHLEVREGIS